MRHLSRVVVLAIATSGLTLAGCAAGPSAPSIDPSQYAAELFELSNAERVDADLPPLEWSDCVAAAAEPRAGIAATADTLDHELLTATCHHGATAGENLSLSDRTPREVVDAWVGSAGHKANVLSEEFVITGIACVAVDGTAEFACSQLFEGD